MHCLKAQLRILLLILLLIICACSSQEEKKQQFFSKGEAAYEAGDYVNARLAFKNVIQIDPKFADAYYMLGRTELKQNYKQAFGYFNRGER